MRTDHKCYRICDIREPSDHVHVIRTWRKDLDSSFKEDIQKANIDIKDLNLLTEGKVPDDADCLMIVSPTSDISEEEKQRSWIIWRRAERP